MAPKAHVDHKTFVMPLSIVGPVDLGRLLRELEALENKLMDAHVRHEGEEAKMPKTTKHMEDMIETNKLDLLKKDDRDTLAQFLKAARDHAPVMHISFGADPAPAFVQKLLAWLREEIHPGVLVTIGLQPNIGAGCLIRTTNKHFDFSLKENFKKNRELLMTSLREKAPA